MLFGKVGTAADATIPPADATEATAPMAIAAVRLPLHHDLRGGLPADRPDCLTAPMVVPPQATRCTYAARAATALRGAPCVNLSADPPNLTRQHRVHLCAGSSQPPVKIATTLCGDWMNGAALRTRSRKHREPAPDDRGPAPRVLLLGGSVQPLMRKRTLCGVPSSSELVPTRTASW